MNTSAVRILIADDHEIFRRGVRTLIETHSKWQICAEATDGIDAVHKIRSLQPDIAILDINMPGMDGLEVLRMIQKDDPRPEVLVLSQYRAEELRVHALHAGAQAYMSKNEAGHDLLATLEYLIAQHKSSDEGQNLAAS